MGKKPKRDVKRSHNESTSEVEKAVSSPQLEKSTEKDNVNKKEHSAEPELTMGDKKLRREEEKRKKEEEELENRRIEKEKAAKLAKKSTGQKKNKKTNAEKKSKSNVSSDASPGKVALKRDRSASQEKANVPPKENHSARTPHSTWSNYDSPYQDDNQRKKNESSSYDSQRKPTQYSHQGNSRWNDSKQYDNRHERNSNREWEQRPRMNRELPNYHWKNNRDSNKPEYKEYSKFYDGLKSRTKYDYKKVREQLGDLFSAPDEYSLAHCVASDMSMSAGIAKTFRAKFKRVPELLNQRAGVGELAVLQHDDRFIYYLVSKEKSYWKPTLHALWQSLQKMKNHMEKNHVKKLAIPQIGCGLDRLNWDDVKQMLEYIFQDSDVEIVVYILPENSFESQPQQKELQRASLVHRQSLELRDIEPDTALIYLGTENGYVSEVITSLDTKWANLITQYKTMKKTIGDTISIKIRGQTLYGLIVKKDQNDVFDFVLFESCLKKIFSELNKNYDYVGIQAFEDEHESAIMDKIIPIIQYTLYKQELHVCWPKNLEHLCPEPKK